MAMDAGDRAAKRLELDSKRSEFLSYILASEWLTGSQRSHLINELVEKGRVPYKRGQELINSAQNSVSEEMVTDSNEGTYIYKKYVWKDTEFAGLIELHIVDHSVVKAKYLYPRI